MPSKCVECDHLLIGDEVEYLYKGKSYCDDCHRAVMKAETLKSNLVEPVIDKYHTDSSILEMWLITLAMMAAMWNLFKWFFRL